MRVEPNGKVVLSRRNLLSLLAKLDGHPRDSHCTLVGGEDANGLVIVAEHDDEHYRDRPYPPGRMAGETEVAIRGR